MSTKVGSQLLGVFWNQEKVGELQSSTGSDLSFTYSKGWIAKKANFISLSMPVRIESYQEEARAFFGNLLPEGDFRRRVEGLVKVSRDNDFSLLQEIGGDCSGALSIGAKPADLDEGFYEPISQTRLGEIVKSEGLSGLQSGGQTNRLSLAGAQGKLAVRYRDHHFELPQKGAPSTHIIKFNRISGEHPHLVENEYFMNRTAFHLGLPVVACQLIRIAEGSILLVERYDRSQNEWPERLHQEDFCQALAYPYNQKYEKEGGPSFAQCVGLIRERLDLKALNKAIEWFIFNLMIGNSDAHAKNIAIIYQNDGIQLAPFYDLVCTRAFVRLDRKLAMACGGEFDPDLITGKQLQKFCKDLSITTRFLNQRINLIAERIPSAMQKAEEDYLHLGFKKTSIQNFQLTIKKIQSRLLKQLF